MRLRILVRSNMKRRSRGSLRRRMIVIMITTIDDDSHDMRVMVTGSE